MVNVSDLIEDKGVLEVVIRDIQSMSHEEYALARKDFFGASDSSILCGVNLYKNLDQLLEEKNKKFITEEEIEVGNKPVVRKGYDLEPIILAKAEKELDLQIHKPQDMFKFKYIDGLSVNYDGVAEVENDGLIPVEAKLVSEYGEKYYNKQMKIKEAKELDMDIEGATLEAHIKRKALQLGIPPYYYTQVQQEIAGLDAKYGYLAALFDKTWDFKVYYIPRDPYVIRNIYESASVNILKVKRDTK